MVGREFREGKDSFMAKVFRKVCIGLVWLSLLPLIATAQITDPVRLESGLLAGMPGSDPAVRAYKGIPYAGALTDQPVRDFFEGFLAE